ncbi:hypothetical protein A3H66_00535 [Candidatus Falkowbacteria bacterium RIFCSPLOWO2_02_FULL_45_21]|uniref:Uncharacterized protein n=1 Tax=Candidatus Falkowbacteria bacterium RIFCSPLOWO2_02_FULL_45_21 TaxID=1797989 RepID=A0A1F5SBH6_9BACT|nr:MAG: hypothetical protein A3H66_00535 [Candidatus Falkowbacteria bacterium RIFCSPLOWO2_02_FULL_45_21]
MHILFPLDPRLNDPARTTLSGWGGSVRGIVVELIYTSIIAYLCELIVNYPAPRERRALNSKFKQPKLFHVLFSALVDYLNRFDN